MKKILLNIIILFILVSCSQNEKTNFEYGNLWKIESKSGIESFIFGTFHLYPSNEMELSEIAIAKLKKCNVLALERDLTDKVEEQKIAEIETESSSLEYYEVLKAEYGSDFKNMEGELIKLSRESEMDLIGLDSSDEILKTMKENSESKIPKKKFNGKQSLAEYQIMLKLYEEESIQKLYEQMTIQSGNKVTKSFVDDRNQNWMDNIESLIENNRTFVAVGIGHLGGEKGILNLLQKKGYKLERM